jgi:endoglucanase
MLGALAPHRSVAQASGVEALAFRFASMTAVTGLEHAMTDSLVALLPGSTRDRAGNVVLALGQGTPRRLLACPLDEVGYVVGNITAEGYLLLRRVSGRVIAPLFDQQLEGHRVTVFGTRGAVPGVVAVRSVHLTRGRGGPGAPDPVFTVDNAYVDVGASSAADARALGLDVLAPVSLAKQPQRYGDGLLAAPADGRRAACAAVVAALLGKPTVKGAVVVAFTVQSQYAQNAGLASVQAMLGPFAETKTVNLATRHSDTPVETVALRDAEALAQEVVTWLEGR